ncbi:MAG: mitofilin family membrane protein [Pseudomonadota bacterium]
MSDEKSEDAGKPGEGAGANGAQEAPALAIITAFGGIRPMASKLEVAVSTVQGWKERGAIPNNRHEQILAAAKKHGITLDAKQLAASDQSEATPAPAAPKDKEKEAAARPAASAIPTSKASSTTTSSSSAGSEAKAAQPESSHLAARSPAPRSSWIPAFLLGALVMAVGAVIAIFTVEEWHGPKGASDEAIKALQSQVTSLSGELAKLREGSDTTKLVKRVDTLTSAESDLSKRIQALEAHAAKPAASPDELASLSKSNQDLSGQVSSLQGKLGELDQMEQQIASLSKSLEAKRALAAGEVAKLLALDRLRFALEESEPYKPALDQFKASLGNDPSVTGKLGPLEDHAAQGLPTIVQLRLEFPAVAKAVVAASLGGEEDDMMTGVWERLANVVSVRPIGSAQGGSPGAIAARAEVALEAGDLPTAVSEMEALSGRPAAAAADWLAKAKARVAAEQALATVSDQLVTQLSAAGG